MFYRFFIASITEPCTHPIQYNGLCAQCGKVLDNENDYSEFSNEDRAPINMSHDSSGITISFDEAQRIEKMSSQQLMQNRRLILVVDLDQTVIQADTNPIIGTIQNNPSDANYNTIKEVRSFQLNEEILIPGLNGDSSRRQTSTATYYVKIRPGLKEFLENMYRYYEMHVYTMATRSYAVAIAKIIDPEGKYFGDRILSRDESGSIYQKSLKRLFPVSTAMVAIIDDRGDVWQWSPNLIKVFRYDFFHVGDINAPPPMPNTVVNTTPEITPERDISNDAVDPSFLTNGNKSDSTLDQIPAEEGIVDESAAIESNTDKHLENSVDENKSNLEPVSDKNDSDVLSIDLFDEDMKTQASSQISATGINGDINTVNSSKIQSSEFYKPLEVSDDTVQSGSGAAENNIASENESCENEPVKVNGNKSISDTELNGISKENYNDEPIDSSNNTIDVLIENNESSLSTNGNSNNFADEIKSTSSDNSNKSESQVSNEQTNALGTILYDNDNELISLEEKLRNLHVEYYREFDRLAVRKGGFSNIEETDLPDVAHILPRMKRVAFNHCVFVFSGLEFGSFDDAEIVQWCRSFGAVVVAEMVDTVTHVIAKNNQSTRARKAFKNPKIKVVSLDWVYKCMSTWQHVPEDKYLLQPPIDEETLTISDEPSSPHNHFNQQNNNVSTNDEEEVLNTESFVMDLTNKSVDWDEMDKELEDFLNSSDEENDEDNDPDVADSLAEERPTTGRKTVSKPLDSIENNDEEEDNDDEDDDDDDEDDDDDDDDDDDEEDDDEDNEESNNKEASQKSGIKRLPDSFDNDGSPSKRHKSNASDESENEEHELNEDDIYSVF